MSAISKFDETAANLILGVVPARASMAIAAEISGISRMTLHLWLRQGERDEADQAWAYVLGSADVALDAVSCRKLRDHLRDRPGLANHIERYERPDEP